MALRLLTAGESHGPGLVAVLEGVPHGLPLTAADIDRDLARRQRGYGRGGRMKIEQDRVRIVGGVRHGRTLGSPIALWIPNRDWENWSRAMAPEPPDAAAQATADGDWRLEPVTRPRPGHADLAGALKYGARDIRDVLERASARETAARVAAGAVARKLLGLFGVRIQSYVLRIGEVAIPSPVLEYGEDGRPPVDPGALEEATEASPVRCPDPAASERMVEAIRTAGQAGDTLGGVFEILVTGVPVGLGSHSSGDRRLEGRLAGALMALNAIKGVEVGLGFAAAALPGSRVHDPIGFRPPRLEGTEPAPAAPGPAHPAARAAAARAGADGWRGPAAGFFRYRNGAGGIEGGITNGEPLVLRAAMKPIATLRRPLPSADLLTGEPFAAHHERSDICAVPAAAVVGEAIVALELAAAWIDKFGGDSVDDMLRNYIAYCERLAAWVDRAPAPEASRAAGSPPAGGSQAGAPTPGRDPR
ncbi:chorismate synthase [Thermaerobacter sp. PB12/4term]|uniref:chorismate synthase n=1 Tax=Thermaerobacter sp. PB12/4term TaxID=2293838 RepID=UPI000E3294E3|nr:chorismate synthase [Thermaerobacter sp. PB12/4term]QIA28137.1 chorismate synthase [Thermaerobacter sp. PB12/4term]